MKHETAVPIGAGGMGEVFKAWDPDLERHVAFKYLKHDDPVLVERLLREARAQARVDHPSVCKVYEVGSDDGRPYIAMEFVDGRPLDEAARGLSTEQKVLLVKKVADAVQAAHSAGLIHRDLKPANILVVDRGGEPHPYVLDFGIARLDEVAGLTITGQVMGTPGYLSPEQAHGDLAAIDRRTDVFSLGVILYELLGDARPFLGESSVEVLLQLIEAEPEPLRKLSPGVPRDLETVVMTCLEKDPERRYPSARALADDLGRFIDGEPVEARPIGLRERLVRRARKHPLTTGALAVAAVALIALVTVAVGGWIKYTTDLKAERNLALDAQAEAERRAEEADEVTDFLISVFQGSDPEVARGGTVTARELLDSGAERVRTSFSDQPLVQIRLMRTLGSIYRKLALLDRAEALLVEAVEVGETLGDDHAEGLGATFDQLGILYAVQGRYDEAEAQFQRSLELRERIFGPEAGELLASIDKLGNLYAIQGRYDEAEPLFQRALAVRERETGPDSGPVAFSLGNLGILLMRQGRFDEAETALHRALVIQKRIHDENDPTISRTLNNLGTVLKEQGKDPEAEEAYRQALAIDEVVFGPDHPTVAMELTNLASALMAQDRFTEAEEKVLRALEIRERTFGRSNPEVANTLNTLGNLYRRTGRLDESEGALVEAQEIWEATLGPDHPNLAYGCNNLGRLRLDQGRPGDAAALFERALAIAEAKMSVDHPEAMSAREGLATAYRAMGREDDALAIERRGESEVP
jgi:serine/threonine-protein kinase